MASGPTQHGAGWRVKWKLPDGRTQSKTMNTVTDARELKRRVEATGDTILSRDLPVHGGRFVGLAFDVPEDQVEPGGETFEEYARDSWLPRQHVAENSVDSYRQAINRLPEFLRKQPIAGVGGRAGSDLLTRAKEVLDDKYRPNTVNATMTLARSIISQAVIEDIIVKSPLLALKPMRRAVVEDVEVEEDDDDDVDMVPLEPHEYELFSSHAQSAMAGMLMDVLAYSGIRVGEALALRVSTIQFHDDGEATFIIRRSVRRNGKLGPTKGRRRRAVDIDADLARALRTWISANRLSGKDFVFPSRQTGEKTKPVSYMWFWREFSYCRLAAEREGHLFMEDGGRMVRIHDLRHSHASWLLALGVDMWKVSRRLGHKSLKVTEDVYSHMTRAGREGVVSVLPYMRTHKPRPSLYAVADRDGGVRPIASEEQLDAIGI